MATLGSVGCHCNMRLVDVGIAVENLVALHWLAHRWPGDLFYLQYSPQQIAAGLSLTVSVRSLDTNAALEIHTLEKLEKHCWVSSRFLTFAVPVRLTILGS